MTLKEDILTGPLAATLAPYVASGNDAAISKILNTANITVTSYLLIDDAIRYLLFQSVWLKIKDSTAEACETIKEVFSRYSKLNLADPMDLAMFNSLADALIAMGVTIGFTPSHKAGLLALADTQISRAKQMDYTASIADVAVALRGA